MKVKPYKYIHLTRKNLGEEVTLEPSGDYTPKGVSFSPSIEQAIDAIPLFFTGSKIAKENGLLLGKGKIRKFMYHVYTPVKEYEAVIPKTADDIKQSGERRVLGKVKAKKIGSIKVTSRESYSGKHIYDINYAWVDRENNSQHLNKDWWKDSYYG